MNDQNLIPGAHKLTLDEQSRGGIASGRARRERADLRKLLRMSLDEQLSGKDITHAQRLTLSLLNIAENPKQGSSAVRAYETILRVVGQDVPEQESDALRNAREILGGVDSVIG